MSKLLKVFITYARKDSAAKDELITRLAVLKREGLISIWHDNEILLSDRWREEIFPHTFLVLMFCFTLSQPIALIPQLATKN